MSVRTSDHCENIDTTLTTLSYEVSSLGFYLAHVILLEEEGHPTEVALKY